MPPLFPACTPRLLSSPLAHLHASGSRSQEAHSHENRNSIVSLAKEDGKQAVAVQRRWLQRMMGQSQDSRLEISLN